jgi:hypothetical protein
VESSSSSWFSWMLTAVQQHVASAALCMCAAAGCCEQMN